MKGLYFILRENCVLALVGPKINIQSIYHAYLSSKPKQSMKIKMKAICISLIPKIPLTLTQAQMNVNFIFFCVFSPFLFPIKYSSFLTFFFLFLLIYISMLYQIKSNNVFLFFIFKYIESFYSYYKCQKFEANPTYGNHPRGRTNRVMVSFRKFKQVNAKDNYMQVYNNRYIDNCI